MRTSALALVGLFFLAPGCATYPPAETRTISQTRTQGAVEGRPTLGHAQPIPGQSTVLVPFAIESEKGLFEKDDPYRRSGYGAHTDALAMKASMATVQSAAMGQVRWHNAIFRDLKTGEEWTILDRRGVIGQWQLISLEPQKDGPWVSRALVFIAVLDDTNRDGLLDDLDARVAILTDADGRHPRIISPRDAQVWSATYDPEADMIFLRIVRDTSGDGKFTYDDVAAPYMIAAGGSGQVQAVVSEESVRKVGGLVDGERTGPPPR